MAIGARFRRRRVEEDLLAVDIFEELMAPGAGNVTVLAFQSKRRPFVVVERRRFPLRRVMAIGALRHFVRKELEELSAVNVLVTLLAFSRRLLEINVNELGLEIRRLVAIDAGNRAVRALERKSRCAVIEAVEFLP